MSIVESKLDYLTPHSIISCLFSRYKIFQKLYLVQWWNRIGVLDQNTPILRGRKKKSTIALVGFKEIQAESFRSLL